MKTSCLIVDDEEIARLRLHKMLSEFSELNIIGEAENGLDAVEKIESLKPELVFLDIQMPGLNGFEVLEKLTFQPIIIFTTAFDEFAIKAFEENAVAYLLKPIPKEKLSKAIEKSRQLLTIDKNKIYTKLLNFVEQKKLKQFVSKLGSKIRFIPSEDVCYIESKDKSTFIHLFDGTYHIIDQTIQELEKSLDKSFIRINRGLIVCIKSIKEAERMGEGKFLFTLSDKKNSQIQSSASYTKLIKENLNL